MQRMKWLAIALVVALGGCGMAKDEHGYPTQVKTNFVTSCTKSGTTTAICECAYGKFQTRFSYDRFREEDAKASGGGSVSPEFQQATISILRECMGIR